MARYEFAPIEAKWRRRWDESRAHATPADPKKKYYVLEMFAYPSGDIHMGHFRNYGVGDVVARFKRMQGFDVLHPFGWDAFGQPAEGAAIKKGVQPREWTLNNIETGNATLKRMCISYDWDREFRTCLPDYYRWTQWIFLQLFKAGMAYRGSSWVNWCNVDQWALTNEQAEGGICWRCKQPVVLKELTGCWFFKYSSYAERLLADLSKIEKGWPETVVAIQKNWIGRSEGAEIEFAVEGGEKIKVFTTRPDTIYGVTFMAVSPESPLARTLPTDPARKAEVEAYIQKALLRDEAQREKEKDGVNTGRVAINPFSGEKVQLWVADYVLGGYGTGVVMGVPAHDQRDFQFAKKYGIPRKVVIGTADPATMTEAFVDAGPMTNSGPFNGTPNQEGIRKVAEAAKAKGIGGPKVTYKLRDWLVSRQRYWGCPIPIIHCTTCGIVPVPEKDLPVKLPETIDNVVPKSRSPLADSAAYMNTTCPTCKGPAQRDPDTMDTFMCSSWYQLRYVDPHNDQEIFSKAEAKKWLPVDLYIGGVEHARGHCLYFRFITKFLHDRGFLDADEPALRLFNHGMVQDEKGETMSKSRGNAVSPTAIMDQYGIDVARLAMFFFAPSEDEIKWSEKGLIGAQRFVFRLWDAMAEIIERADGVSGKPASTAGPYKELRRKIHTALRKATESFDGDLHFNTVIASVMEALNAYDAVSKAPPSHDDEKRALREFAGIATKILAPLAPFIGEEFHEQLGGKESVFASGWPAYDPAALTTDEIEVVVQVNGKVRGKVVMATGSSEEAIKAAALKEIAKQLDGKEPKKVIVVKGRLVNVVV
jgi:leucyl-tRNA synthetase